MEQLTTLDAGFLHAEDSDRHVSLAIGGLAIVEGPAPDHDSVMSTFAQRIGACARFAQRLRVRGSIWAHRNGSITPGSTWLITYGASRCHRPATTPHCLGSLPM